jgi:hypothetical protein
MHVMIQNCPQCQGKGWLPYLGPMGCSDARETCWVCQGSGRDPHAAKRESGEKLAEALFRSGKQEAAIDKWLRSNRHDLQDREWREVALKFLKWSVETDEIFGFSSPSPATPALRDCDRRPLPAMPHGRSGGEGRTPRAPWWRISSILESAAKALPKWSARRRR